MSTRDMAVTMRCIAEPRFLFERTAAIATRKFNGLIFANAV